MFKTNRLIINKYDFTELELLGVRILDRALFGDSNLWELLP